MVGIKGTGMAALAEILCSHGVELSGSDTDERFYTDDILAALPVRLHEGFATENLPPTADLVIYSAAYDPQTHPELTAAADRGMPLMSYPQAIGELSARTVSVAIAGVHGKTTTTAMIARIVQHAGLRGTVLAGSSLADLGGRCTYIGGEEFFVAEACEYRRNFLSFSPRIVVVTSIEADHLDYFHDAADVFDAFVQLSDRIPDGGTLITCADDDGARALHAAVLDRRGDALEYVTYGRAAPGPYTITSVDVAAGQMQFSLAGFSDRFTLVVPGRHNVLNAAAAVAVTQQLPGVGQGQPSGYAQALAGFHGTRRRSEVVGEAGGVLVLDDYGHHPTAIASTLAGLRSFYPERRLVLDFMSHTYSRTRALLDEFADSLTGADVVMLHRIYASAREVDSGTISGEDLADALRSRSSSRTPSGVPEVYYEPEPDDALGQLLGILAPGDLFVTMGAGDNWRLGRMVLEALGSDTATGGAPA